MWSCFWYKYTGGFFCRLPARLMNTDRKCQWVTQMPQAIVALSDARERRGATLALSLQTCKSISSLSQNGGQRRGCRGGVGLAAQHERNAIQWTTEYSIFVLSCQLRRQYRIIKLDRCFEINLISGSAHHLSQCSAHVDLSISSHSHIVKSRLVCLRGLEGRKGGSLNSHTSLGHGRSREPGLIPWFPVFSCTFHFGERWIDEPI